jgi:hypothetical protein
VEVDSRRNPVLARLASPQKLSGTTPAIVGTVEADDASNTTTPIVATTTTTGAQDEDVMAMMRAANRPAQHK